MKYYQIVLTVRAPDVYAITTIHTTIREHLPRIAAILAPAGIKPESMTVVTCSAPVLEPQVSAGDRESL